MGFPEAVQSYLGGYVRFDGRSPRVMMWWILLFVVVLSMIASVLDRSLALSYMFPIAGAEPVSLGGPIEGLLSLALLLPNLALWFRRLHDRNKSAWWILLVFLPIIGWIVLFVWTYCLRGTVGDNRFGPDPLASKA